ncbi:MAG: YggS family pyridoxal phosphate enzyme [Candidatus Omnitrophica bacterium CG1_02_49_10]|nr:MAG: YggS family pyridoxal phosphate enzyme [Candidatus Omnitrophica bacterium CG1_02_49_10]
MSADKKIQMVTDNIRDVRDRIVRAAERAKRAPSGITLVCVTKEASIPQIEEALASGVTDIGENRVRDASSKFRRLHPKDYELRITNYELRKHMIGHLQTNKVRKALEIFDIIHSVDSLRLAGEIDRCARASGRIFPVLLEVNVSGEKAKHGFSPQELNNALKAISDMANIKIDGLMTMAPMSDDPENSRPYFRRLRELRDKINEVRGAKDGIRLLSMGMSRDFEVAIEEGADMVRVGSAVFKS